MRRSNTLVPNGIKADCAARSCAERDFLGVDDLIFALLGACEVTDDDGVGHIGEWSERDVGISRS